MAGFLAEVYATFWASLELMADGKDAMAVGRDQLGYPTRPGEQLLSSWELPPGLNGPKRVKERRLETHSPGKRE